MTAQYSRLIQKINKRKSLMIATVQATGIDILDIYHGEMAYSIHPDAQTAILELTRQILSEEANLLENNGTMYSKSQPAILKQLAAEKLYPQFLNKGVDLTAGDIVVCPYSSIIMLETALMTLAMDKPGGIILCPDGFYKSNALHIEKFDLQLKCITADLHKDGRITADSLKRAIQKHRAELCGVLFTMPGNPLNPDYSQAELDSIGQVLVEEGVKVIVDSAFTGIHNEHRPLATVIANHQGEQHLLHDQTLTITGLSKAHHAPGPYKIGVATSGDQTWLATIKSKLVVSFQRETTAFARAILEHTPLSYFTENQKEMMQGQVLAKQYIASTNAHFDHPVIFHFGEAKYGPFMLLGFSHAVLQKAGIEDSWQLADILLGSVGLNVVAGCRMGITEPCVRININAPRKNGLMNATLLPEVFDRLSNFVTKIIHEGCTYDEVLSNIGIMDKVRVKC